MTENIVAFEYAPYSLLFPRSACVVHQAGVGTTGQVLRAGVPHLIVPFAHDQPDNAARCRRLGVAKMIRREKYSAERAEKSIARILTDESYSVFAKAAHDLIKLEGGTAQAVDQIEKIL